MARGKIKYRDVVGGRHGKQKNKKKQFPKKYSLHKSEKKQKIFKRRFTNDISVQLQVKKLKTKELPVTEIFSESEESEIDDVKKLLNTFDGNLNDRRLLAVDSTNSENENEETDDNLLVDEGNLYNLDDVLSDEGSLPNENDQNQNHQDKAVNKSDTNELQSITRSECKSETEEEIEYETDPENENGEDDHESSQDPFVKHFHFELPCNIIESLENSPISVNSYDEYWPILGKLNIQIPKCEKIKNTIKTEYIIPEKKSYAPPGELPRKLDVKCIKTEELFIKPQIVTNLTKANKSFISYTEGIFSSLQAELFSIMNNYQNLYFPRRSFNNAEEIRYIYCLHAANHILKTRIKVIHHNTRLSKKDEVPEEFRDQGLVRPKVLIIVPFKDAAYKIIQMLINIILPDDKGNVMNKKRFIDDYTGNELIFPKKNPKPEDYEQTFQGNTSDDFKIGITITKKSLKLYADFYSSDVIVASPLGLRTIIGAEGEQERDYDFLASIELLVFDQTEIFLMQNWDHVFHILNHMHLQPKKSHGTDFSRVRTWSLNGWSKYYRQTLIFSSLVLPEINAVFNKKCQNYAGKVRIANHIEFGCINQVFIQLPHVFHRFDAQNITEVIDTRFEFFLNKILPIQKDSLMKQTLIFIPSYFDYVRIRNYFKKEDLNFVQICEYSKENKVARARDMFYHGDAHFLLYTERFHFFNRKQIKGIRHLVFYQPPNFPHFYYELCNLMQEANMNKNIGNTSNMTVTVIYSKYDIHQLSAIVNTERAAKMIQSERKVHMMLTGVD